MSLERVPRRVGVLRSGGQILRAGTAAPAGGCALGALAAKAAQPRSSVLSGGLTKLWAAMETMPEEGYRRRSSAARSISWP